MLDIQEQIFELTQTLNFEIKGGYLQFSYDQGLINFLEKKGIKYETVKVESVFINYVDLGFTVFKNPTQYLTLSTVKKNLDSLILNCDEHKALSKIGDKYYKDFKPTEGFFFFSNAKYFFEFIEFLKSKDQETEDAFHFIDYANDVSRKIVLTSLTEKSRIILKYFNEIPQTPDYEDLSIGYNLFKECFSKENINFPKFLKSSLIKFASRYEENQRLKLVFQNLKSIVEDARINFEIYINNLSIDKIRKDYDDYKSKYFAEVSEVLKKLTQQIIGFPIAIASTLFAVEKVKANSTFLWFIAIVILVSTVYLIFLLRMNFRDLKYVEQLSDKDYQAIKDNNFFIKFPDEFQIFKRIKIRMTTRIKNLVIVCESYFLILSLANTALICLIMSYLDVPGTGIVFIAIVIMLIMILARNQIWDEKNVV